MFLYTCKEEDCKARVVLSRDCGWKVKLQRLGAKSACLQVGQKSWVQVKVMNKANKLGLYPLNRTIEDLFLIWENNREQANSQLPVPASASVPVQYNKSQADGRNSRECFYCLGSNRERERPAPAQ